MTLAIATGYGLSDARADCPRFAEDSNKYSRGKLVVAGGSRRYPSAPLLAGCGGLYAGAGLVVVCVPSSAEILSTIPKSLILRRIDSSPEAGVFDGGSIAPWKNELAKAKAIVLGPGMDSRPELDGFLAEALAVPLPKVVDADALNRIAGCPALLPSRDLCGTMVLTPHEGEAARLEHAFGISSGGASREERAAALSRATGCVVLLKGAGTLVAEPGGSLTVNTSGNPRLATAGTGDVLSGVIGALLANGLAAPAAARLGAFLHGLAADRTECFIADDLPRAVAKIIATELY